jgi:predicted DNA-binding transcriptional regulator YafY
MYANAERLLQAAFMMQASRLGVSLQEFQVEFGIGRRTAERLRDAALRVFPQAEEVPSGDTLKRWPIPTGVLNGLVAFEADELAELALAADQLRHEGLDARARTLERLRTKLLGLLSAAASARVGPDLEALLEAEGHAMRPGPRPAIPDAVLTSIRQALLGCEVLRLHYRKRTTRRRTVVDLEPHGLLFGQRHYLVAFPAARTANYPKLYALANVESVEMTGSSFVRRPEFNLQEYAARSFGVFQEARQEVVWEFSPESVADAREHHFHPSETKHTLPGGALEVRFTAGGLLEMAWHLFIWGSAVRVIQPRSLHETYVAALRRGSLAIAKRKDRAKSAAQP